MAEQVLRAQGFTDAEIEELRRTGQVERADDSGATVSINAAQLGAGQVPPETIEMLRRFKRFIPKDTLHQVERATGEDIDGDGHVGTPGAAGSTAATAAPVDPTAPSRIHPASGALPTGPSGGPFVQRTRGASLLPAIVLIALAAAAVYFLVR